MFLTDFFNWNILYKDLHVFSVHLYRHTYMERQATVYECVLACDRWCLHTFRHCCFLFWNVCLDKCMLFSQFNYVSQTLWKSCLMWDKSARDDRKKMLLCMTQWKYSLQLANSILVVFSMAVFWSVPAGSLSMSSRVRVELWWIMRQVKLKRWWLWLM
jgi:hypothetical protein